MKISTLDDSLYFNGNLFVYSHALTVSDDPPFTLSFCGNKEEIYTHEDKIYSFIEENLDLNTDLYACNHYRIYQSVWEDLVFDEANCFKRSRAIKRQFTIAHHAAKSCAKELFYQLLEKNGPTRI